VSVQAKRLEYRASLDRAGNALAEDGSPLELTEAWTPEHLLLAALVRCSVASLGYHARRAGLELEADGSAWGAVTRREEDGRYAFVELEVQIVARIEPPPESLEELLAKAERDCFVGASLTSKPRYEWVVNA